MISEPFESELDLLPHEHFMHQALLQARYAFQCDEVPVGTIITLGNRIIAASHNQREQLKDPTAHAEILAITQATQVVDDWRLEDCTMYVTLEPCPMCAGAILQARIPRLVYGAADPKGGAVDSLFNLLYDPRLNHQVETVSGILADECGAILTEFFSAKRKQGKK